MVRRSFRFLLAAATAVALTALAWPALAAASATAPLGHACIPENGVRFCPTPDLASRVPSFDGVPLDVDVTLPETGDGPFPTIVMLHGFGGDKTDFETASPEGPAPTEDGGGSTIFHYNNVFYAQRGFAVVNYTARGFGNSCGGGPAGDHSGPCGSGYIRLADSRYEARDTQYLLGLLADEGVTLPRAIGVTGISYGGGQSIELAFLRNRVRTPDGKLHPWRSPQGKKMEIAAARLWDVSPEGTQRLIDRGVYALTSGQSGKIAFQLHGNGYHFAKGHKVELQLLGRDAPYYQPSSLPFSVRAAKVRVTLPTVRRNPR